MVVLSSIIVFFLVSIIRFYQYFISPLMKSNCRFYPTCSAYALISLRNYSILFSIALIIKRLLKCHPFYVDKYENIKIKIKDKSEY